MDIEILKIAANTKNNKEIKNFTHRSKNKNPLCGDEMEISLIVKDHKISDIGYQSKSCIYCQASASLLSKLSINKSIEKINEISTFVGKYCAAFGIPSSSIIELGNNSLLHKRQTLEFIICFTFYF